MIYCILFILFFVVGLVLGGQVCVEGILYFVNWLDYYLLELLKKFEKDIGIKVIFDFYDSNEMLLVKFKVGGGVYDVVVLLDSFIEIFVKEGLL